MKTTMIATRFTTSKRRSREDSNTIDLTNNSIVSMEKYTRPKKRVRISFEQPEVFHYSHGERSRSCAECCSVSPALTQQHQQERRQVDDGKDNNLSCFACSSNSMTNQRSNGESCSATSTSATTTGNPSWLTRRDLAFFRASAKRLCRSINLDNVLQKAYNDSSFSPGDDISDEKDRLMSDFDRTNALLESSDYSKQRGLERWSSSQHSFCRSIKIVEVKSAVLLEQASQFLSGKTDVDRLAAVAQEASMKSQRFAQILALADATYAMQVQQSAEGCRAA